MPDNKDTVDRLLAWLDSATNRVSQYHDQKERMAWVATTLYVPIVIVFAYKAAPVADGWIQGVVTGILILIFFAAFLFINMQLLLHLSRLMKDSVYRFWKLWPAGRLYSHQMRPVFQKLLTTQPCWLILRTH